MCSVDTCSAWNLLQTNATLARVIGSYTCTGSHWMYYNNLVWCTVHCIAQAPKGCHTCSCYCTLLLEHAQVTYITEKTWTSACTVILYQNKVRQSVHHVHHTGHNTTDKHIALASARRPLSTSKCVIIPRLLHRDCYNQSCDKLLYHNTDSCM